MSSQQTKRENNSLTCTPKKKKREQHDCGLAKKKKHDCVRMIRCGWVVQLFWKGAKHYALKTYR